MSYERGERGVGCLVTVGAFMVIDAIWGAIAHANYNKEDAAEYLHESGYSNVQHLDTDTWMVMYRGCGYDQAVGHEFSVTGPTGVQSRVVVCDNLFQGASIRQAG